MHDCWMQRGADYRCSRLVLVMMRHLHYHLDCVADRRELVFPVVRITYRFSDTKMNDTNNRRRLEQILQANACSDECSARLDDNNGRVSEIDHRGTVLEICDFCCGRVVYIMMKQ